MSDALSFIRDQHPDLWPQTRYRVIEISPELARLQRERAKESKVDHKVEILNTDVFDWEGGDQEPCYVVALEMLVGAPTHLSLDIGLDNLTGSAVELEVSGQDALLVVWTIY